MGVYALAFFCGFLTILIELVLARALDFSLNSFVSWMCISAAMFGIGLGGLLFDWRPNAGRRLWVVAGLLLLIVPFAHNHLSLNGNSSACNYAALILILCAPFALTSWVLLQIFAHPQSATGRVYFFDLLGGGLGAVAAHFMIGPLTPGQILIVAGLFCLAFGLSEKKLVRSLAFAFAAIASMALIVKKPASLEFKAKTEKRLSYFLKSEHIEKTIWTPNAKVDVVSAPNGAKHIIYDGGEMLSTIYPFNGDFSQLRGNFRQRLHSDFWNPGVVASHYLKDGSDTRVLAIGAAGGQEIKAAILFGAREIEVAEIMGELLELGKNDYSQFNGGIFLRPEVSLFARDGRAHLRSRPGKLYDIIQLNSVHGSSSRGSSMGALQISTLATVEAFAEYFSHLAPDGILHLNYLYYPRLITTMAEAWKRIGRTDFRSHVLVVQSLGQADFLTTTMVKISPWTINEVAQIANLFQITGRPTDRYALVENPKGQGRLPNELFSGRLEEYAEQLPYRIFPATDDQPYFKFLRKYPIFTDFTSDPAITPDIENYLYRFRTRDLPGDVFPLVMLAAGAAAIFLTAFAIGLIRLKSSRTKWNQAAYFFLTGFSFILLEAYFIYRTTLWLGSPHLALALALGVVMVCAGVGGMFNRWSPEKVCLLAALVAALVARIPIGGGILVSLILVGLFLGMPFVSGINAICSPGRERSRAFLVSGLGAGFGGYCAVVGSLMWSFTVVLIAGCVGYAGSALIARFTRA